MKSEKPLMGEDREIGYAIVTRLPDLASGQASIKDSGARGEIRTLKHLFLRQAAILIRARWHSGAQGRI